MEKLRVELDMKPCQFMTISHTVTQMLLVNSSFKITQASRFLLRLQRSCEPTTKLQGCVGGRPEVSPGVHALMELSCTSAFLTQLLPPTTPKLSLLMPWIHLVPLSVYCLHPALKSLVKRLKGGQNRNQTSDPLYISRYDHITRLGSLKSPGAGGCRQIPTAGQLRIAQASKMPPTFFNQSLNSRDVEHVGT